MEEQKQKNEGIERKKKGGGYVRGGQVLWRGEV